MNACLISPVSSQSISIFDGVVNIPSHLPCSSKPPIPQEYIRNGATFVKNRGLYIPHFDSEDTRRALSLNLGGGNCKWQSPNYNVPSNVDFHKTVIAGYPSGDKRMVFVQMEALTGLRKFDCCPPLVLRYFLPQSSQLTT